MKLIVITPEKSLPHEAEVINALFDAGLEQLHLRKPRASYEEVEALIGAVATVHHPRIVLHDHFGLVSEYSLKGVHLNRRNGTPPQTEKSISVSRSCHSLKEAEAASEQCDYFFLSPLFDSISKAGYTSSFTEEELLQAKAAGIINRKAIALGGVTPARIPLAARYGFGGVAVLGALWKGFEQDNDTVALIRSFEELTKRCYYL